MDEKRRKRRKRLYIAAFLLVALFIVNTVVAYFNLAEFPDRERAVIQSLIDAGDMPKCDPSSSVRDFDHSSIDDLRSAKERCFSEARIDKQLLHLSPGKPEYDDVYFHLSCSTDELSARFEFFFRRTELIASCQYSLGEQLESIPEFIGRDLIAPPDPPWFVYRILSRIVGHPKQPLDRSF